MACISTYVVKILFIFLGFWFRIPPNKAYSLEESSPTSHNHSVNDSLKHLHILFRHGDRSPIVNMPAILHEIPSAWSQGFGMLTDKGVEQHFFLGKWLRSKYQGFVPSKYNGSHYHVRSTDVDRTLMSAMANAAGFYNQSPSPLSAYGINWFPIPVHTKPQVTDTLLGVAPCPYRDSLQRIQMDSQPSIEFEKNHSNLFVKLTNVSGIGPVNRHNVWSISDFITCMIAHNITLPDWCTDDFLAELYEVNRFYWVKKYSSSDDIIRLEIGVFLNTFVKHIHSIIHGEQLNLTYEYTLSTEHMMIYSAHDTDVTYILAGFGVYNNQTINYASTVILELHGPDKSSNESDYRIKLLYKKGWTDETGEYLTLPACKGQPGYNGCPVNLVLEQIKPLLLSTDRFYKECSIDQPDSVNYRLHPIVFIFVGASISSVIMLLVFWYYSLRLRRYNSLDVTEQPIL
ncbi:uncharacterized protein DC041_0012222 [Schistosoma bovis]|uniref:acid phosphatase n=1 Tax=Schistosoma bovis TaxID=6184 RepID=A0A430Q4P7_SCHBO|nr:uncharacterized protein DC041_0012222 [Schistosoma bovis]